MSNISNISRLADMAFKTFNLNGAFGVRGGSFNALCGAIATKTGASFELVKQVVVPKWNDWLDTQNCSMLLNSMDMDGWHSWEESCPALKVGQ